MANLFVSGSIGLGKSHDPVPENKMLGKLPKRRLWKILFGDERSMQRKVFFLVPSYFLFRMLSHKGRLVLGAAATILQLREESSLIH